MTYFVAGWLLGLLAGVLIGVVVAIPDHSEPARPPSAGGFAINLPTEAAWSGHMVCTLTGTYATTCMWVYVVPGGGSGKP